MHRGWKKLWVCTEDSPVLLKPVALQLMIYFICKASRHKRTVNFNGHIIKLEPGQAIAGRKALAKRFGIGEQKIRTALNFLKNNETIAINPTKLLSVVTLINWEQYQPPLDEDNQVLTNVQPSANQPITNRQPSANQPITTNRELIDLNRKNKKEENAGKNFQPPTPEKSSDKTLNSKKPSSKKKILNQTKPKIFGIWKEISEAWRTPGRTGGKAAHIGIERYIQNQSDANRAVQALEALRDKEPSKFHTENTSNYWSLEWIFRARDSKGNAVDRPQEILDGRMFEESSTPMHSAPDYRKTYSPEYQKMHGVDKYGLGPDEEGYCGPRTE